MATARKQEENPVQEVLSIAEAMGKLKRPRETVRLCLDADAVAEAEELEQVLAAAVELDQSSNEPDRAPRIERQVREARARAEASVVRFQLQALPHRRWATLISEHPPTPEQRAEAPATAPPLYNIETFPGELVRLQLLSPQVESAEQWAAYWDELSDGQVRQLWQAANRVQMSDGSLGKSQLASETPWSSANT